MTAKSNRGIVVIYQQLVLCLLIFTSVFSQTPLDLETALHLARQNNLKLQQQKKSEQIAVLEERVQKAQRLPTLDFAATSEYLSEINAIDLSQTIGIPGRRVQLGGHDRSELRLSVQQPLFTGFRLQSQVELASNATLSEQTKFETLANAIYHQIHSIFYQYQSLVNQRKILEESQKRLNVQLNHVRNLFHADQIMAFDTLQVYNQALAIQIDLQNLLLAGRLMNLQMARILDLPEVRPISEIELQRPAETLDHASLDRFKAEAYRKRPELSSIRLAQNRVKLQQKLLRANYFPTVFARGNWHYAKPGLDPVNNKWMDYFSIGVNLQWNLWRWRGDQNKVKEFQVQLERLSLEEKEQLKAIDYEVEESFEKLNFSLQELSLAERLHAQERERYRIISAQHQEGIASTNDLITAETDLTRVELKTQQALVKYYLALADLKRAVGTIGESVE